MNRETAMSYILDWGANFRGNLNLSPLQENLLKRVSPNVYNAYEASGAIFASKEKGTPKQLERALEYAKKMKAKYGDNLVKVSGHSSWWCRSYTCWFTFKSSSGSSRSCSCK